MAAWVSLRGLMRAGGRGDLALAGGLFAGAGVESAAYGRPVASLVSVAVCALALTVRRRVPLAVAIVAGLSLVAGCGFGGLGHGFGPGHGLSGPLVFPLAAVLVAVYSVAAFAPLRRALVGGSIVLACVSLEHSLSEGIPVASLAFVLPELGLVTAVLVAVYSVAAFAPRRRALVGGSIVVACVSLEYSFSGGGSSLGFVPLELALVVGGPWVAGRGVYAYRRQAEMLRVLTAELERERDASARLAVVAERARVASELHDAVAHAVSLTVVQAAAGEQALAAAPERARDPLRAVQAT